MKRMLIEKYFKQPFSREVADQFAGWFRSDECRQEKDEALEQIWDSLPAQSGSTNGLRQLHEELGLDYCKPQRRRRMAIAICCCIIVTGLSLIIQRQFLKPETIQECTLVTSADSKGEFCLPDGTQVYLNAGASLSYIKSSPRNVLLKGEALFDVARDDQNPFIVQMGTLSVKVLGTRFDARYTSSDGIEEVILQRGSVLVEGASESRRLVPGERLYLDEGTGEVVVEKVNLKNYTSWVEPNLAFRNEKLSDIAMSLSRWYNVNIDIDNKSKEDIHLSFTISRETLGETLSLLEFLTGMECRMIDNNHIMIHK